MMSERFKQAVILIAVLISSCSSMLASGENENIALGKKYKFNFPANYPHCSGPSDSTELTDGKRVVNAAFAWTEQEMVGWRGVDAMVQLDLEKVEPISRIVVNTHFGYTSSAFLPRTVAISVSDDGKNFYRIAEKKPAVDQREQVKGQYQFDFQKLRLRGRYVLVEMFKSGTFIFCDEIEVYRAGHAEQHIEPPKANAFRLATRMRSPNDFPGRHLKGKARLREMDRQKAPGVWLKRLIGRLESYHGKDVRLKKRIEAVKAQIAKSENVKEDQYKTLLAEVMAISTEGKRKRFADSADNKVHLWWAEPWVPITPVDEPLVKTDGANRSMVIAGDEVAPAALMITNVSKENVNIDIGLNSKPPGSRDAIKIRQAYIHTHNDKRPDQTTSSPLPLIEAMKNPRLTIPAGQTIQIWLECRGKELGEGKRTYNVSVKKNDTVLGSAKLDIEVKRWRLPACTIKSNGYDYVGARSFLKGKEQAVLEDFREHGITHLMMTNSALAAAEFDKNGNLKAPIDFKGMDRELEKLGKNGKNFGLIIFFYKGPDGYLKPRNTLKWGSLEWERALNTWARAMADHLRDKGWPRDRFFFYPYDEVGTYSARQTKDVVQAIGIGNPDINFYITACGGILDTPAEEEIIETRHLPIRWVFDYNHLSIMDKFSVALRRPWTYCVFNQAADPYPACRLIWWKAVKHDLGGVAFWSYGSTSNKGWDSAWIESDGDGSHDYTMVYDQQGAPFATTEDLIPSKRWEAWRQGWFDSRYVQMAKTLAGQKGKTEFITRINSLADWVLEKPEDYTRADQARKKLLEIIKILRSCN